MATATTPSTIDNSAPRPAMRTPLYPILSIVGLVMAISAFMTWLSADGQSFSGLDTGGWGLAAIVVGLVIFALGIIGYIVNPFSETEALFIVGFATAALVGAIWKLVDAASLIDLDVRLGLEEADSEVAAAVRDQASAGFGLWLVLVTAALALAGGLWIFASRPSAERRLG